MNLKVLALSGLGVLGVGAVGAGGIAISVGGGQESEENAIPASAPTISKKLLDKGYIYNPPKLSDHSTLIQSCTENLLSKDGLDNSKLYGCGAAKLDLWDSGTQFKNETVDYLQFTSEIFLRKRDEGWRINTRIDNRSADILIYQHLLTHYKKKNDKGLEIEKSFLIKFGFSQKSKGISFSGQKSENPDVGIGTLNLNIKLPRETDRWYHKNNYLIMSYIDGTPALIKTHKKSKTWSGIWIDKTQSNKQWIFQDMEVFIGDKKNSQVFCKENSCGADTNSILYKLNHSQGKLDIPKFWWEAENKLTPQRGNYDSDVSDNTTEARQSILDFVGESQGEWVNSEQICIDSTSTEDVNEEKLNQLELWCSKK